MKNITLSAEEHLLRQARQHAEAESTTLNNVFRRWLAQYAQGIRTERDFLSLMNHFEYCQPGRTFTREEMNER